MRPRTLVLLCVVVAAVASVISVPLAYAASQGTATPFGTAKTASQSKPPPPTLVIPADPASIKPPPGLDHFGWTLIDRQTGQMAGSDNAETWQNTTESMIKAWIAADYLRHHDNPPAGALDELKSMIIHSDDNIAQKYFEINGGEQSIDELVQVCGLKNTQEAPPPVTGMWSYTMMSPADAARMGLCIADGKAAGDAPATKTLLEWMRGVQGSVEEQQATSGGGRWGIIDGLPQYLQGTTAMKNGWTAQVLGAYDWHINCLAINTGWVLAIELQYPWHSPDGRWEDADNLAFGANACATVTKELVGVPAG